jgi:hypothetical protein
MTDGDDPVFSPPQETFPGFTQWEYATFCCVEKAIRTHPNNAIFLGHWEVSLGMPIAVGSLLISSYLVAMFLIFPTRSDAPISAVILSIIFSLTCICYARTIIDGPGYFPFFYPLQSPGDFSAAGDSSSLLHSDDLSPSGIATTKEQIDWVAHRPKPNRCIFSRIARRIVLRPDHFCGWTATWVGKRNHKFFILFNFWCALYITAFTYFDVVTIVGELADSTPSPFLVVFIVYAFMGVSFALMTWSFACSHAQGMCMNVTSWEEWNGIPAARFDRGCVENCEEVCGSRKKWFCWLCPVSPWRMETNEDFVGQWVPYRDDGKPIGDYLT